MNALMNAMLGNVTKKSTLGFLAFSLLASVATITVARAEDGPVQIYIRKDADTVQTQQASPSDYTQFRTELGGKPEDQRPLGDPQPFQAADAYLMLNFTEGQTRWLYGF